MITRGARICLELIVGSVAVLGLAAVLVVWRLSEEPLSIDFVKDYLEAGLLNEETGTRVEADHIFLQWDQNASELEVRAEGIRAFEANGQLIAAIPAADVRLAWSALLVGVVAPQSFEISGARLRLERTAEGKLRFADAVSAKEDKEAGEASALSAFSIRGLLGETMRAADPSRPFTYLERVIIRDGRIRLVDLSRGQVIDAEDTRIELLRLPSGLRADLQFSPILAGLSPAVSASVRYELESEELQAEFAISELLIGNLAGLDDALAPLSGVDIPLTLEGFFDLDPDGKLKSARLGFDAKPGPAFLPQHFSQALPVSLLSGFLIYDATAGRLTLNPLRLSFGTEAEAGPAFTASANVELRADGIEVAAELKGANIQATELPTYWPLNVSKGGRAWVLENITAGKADDLSLSLRFALGRDGEMTIHEVDGGFSLEDMEVYYLKPIPPITQASGRAHIKPGGLFFEVESARRGNIRIKNAQIDMPNLGADVEIIDITFESDGPVAAALDLLAHPRLDLISRLGIDHKSISGEYWSEVKFKMPMIDALDEDDIEVSATAKISGAKLVDLVLSRDITDGEIALALTGEAMTLEGDARFVGMPFSFEWNESFTGKPGPRTVIKANFPSVDDAARNELGFDISNNLTGQFALEVEAASGERGDFLVDFVADLERTQMQVAEMKWRKEAGVAGRATGRIVLQDDQLERVEDIVVVAGDLRLSAALDFAPGAKLEQADFARLSFGQQSVSGLTLRPVGSGYQAYVESGTIDLSPWLAGKTDDDERAADASKKDAQPRDAEAPVDIDLTAPKVDRVYFAEDRYLSDVSLTLVRRNGAWVSANLKGRVDPRFAYAGEPPDEAEETPRETDFSLEWGPLPDRENEYRLEASMSDSGAFLRAVDVYDDIEGGSFELKGAAAGPFPEHPVELEVEGGDYRLVKAPVMARVLAAASLTGLGNLLSGEGIDFERIAGSATYHELQFQEVDARTSGSALGITTKGNLDLDQNTLNLRGEIVPAYSVNNAAAGIPIIGAILTGGEGGGIIAFTYRVEGDIDDPDVAVKPLAALTPGFLRSIFLIEPGSGDYDEADPDGDVEPGPQR